MARLVNRRWDGDMPDGEWSMAWVRAAVCDPERVQRIDLFNRLAVTRYLLETASARFAEMTDGVDHPRVRDARDGLRGASAAVTYAAGGISKWTRSWLGLVILGIGSWTVAAFTGRVLGLADGWTIAITLAVAWALIWPIYVLNAALARWVNRRRTKRPDSPPPIAAPSNAGPAAEVQQLLLMARVELSAVMVQHSAAGRFGSLATTAAGFDWLRQHDQHLRLVSLADRIICTVIHSIDIWSRIRPEQR